MNISYIRVGDYFIPDLALPEESRPIGKWGRMHREYLREYKPIQYKLKAEITENRVRGKRITLYQKLHIQLTESLFSEVFLLLAVFAYLFYSGITSVLLAEIVFLAVEVYLTSHILLGIIRSITHVLKILVVFCWLCYNSFVKSSGRNF